MSNINKNNRITSINREVSLLKDRLKINEKRFSQFQNALTRVGRVGLKQGQKIHLSETKTLQEILEDMFKNKIKLIKKKDGLLNNALLNVQKRKKLFKKWLKENSKNAESFTE